MFKLITLFFLSTSAFASTVILEKQAVSGYVPPEQSFTKDCKVYLEGYVESQTTDNFGAINGFSRRVPYINLQTIRLLNRIALKGEIVDSPGICDGGTTILKGYVDSNEVEIETSIDCGVQRHNIGHAANLLKSMARELCGF